MLSLAIPPVSTHAQQDAAARPASLIELAGTPNMLHEIAAFDWVGVSKDE